MDFETFRDLFQNAFGIEDFTKMEECLCDEPGMLSLEKLEIFVGLYQLLP